MRYLGVLFVPAAVGVVLFWPHLQRQALAIAVALVASVVATIAVAALVAKLLSRGDSDAA
jgi:holin-like protein